MPIPFKELAGSPIETFGPEGMKAERRLLCAYEDRHAVVAALVGDGYAVGGGPRAPYPGRPDVAAIRVRVEPFHKKPDDQGEFDDLTADLNSYSLQFVELLVNYEILGSQGHPAVPKSEPGTILTYRMDRAGENVTLPPYALRWAADLATPLADAAAPVVRIPIVEHHLTWHYVVRPPWEAIRRCTGAVNADAMLGAAAETLLLDGVKAERQLAGLDDLQQTRFGWQLSYVFREKAVKVLVGDAVYGWNHGFGSPPNPEACWDRLVDQNGFALYRTVDFGPLLEFGGE